MTTSNTNAVTANAQTDSANDNRPTKSAIPAKRYKAQVVTDGQSPWPYLGNAFENRDGSISLYLDVGCAIVLKSGRE